MRNFKTKKLSIIIPCYNDFLYIEEAIDSALNQTIEDKEIIVVDDGSNDTTKKELQRLKTKIDLLLVQENKGTSSARNTGIIAAKGEYILVHDSDDFFEPNFSEAALQILNERREVKIVSCYSRWFNNKDNFKIYKPTGGNLKDILLKNIAMGSSMFRKEDWVKANGYDEIMKKGYEDWEFYLRLLSSGGEAYINPKVLFNYRNKTNSRNKQANDVKYEILEYIFLKHQALYKEHFPVFIKEWLEFISTTESFKQQVMDSLDYKVGSKILKPFRKIGLFPKQAKK